MGDATPGSVAESDEIVAVKHCETPEEFLNAISPRNPMYSSMLPGGWVFRGHSDDSFKLLPNALREESKSLRELASISPKNNREQQFAEKVVLRKFLEFSDRAGLQVPEDTQRLRRMLEDNPGNLEAWPPDEVLSLMALAQHSGVPTRLLDWTRNPLKAALFAVDSVAADSTGGLLSVWAFGIEKLSTQDRESNPFTVITAPSASNSNLRAQEGLFTLARHIKADSSPIDRTPFDEILRKWVNDYEIKTYGPWFHRITLPKSQAAFLRLALNLEGVNLSSLFPDFYGVVRAMREIAGLYGVAGAPGRARSMEFMSHFYIARKGTVSKAELLAQLFAPPPPGVAGTTFDPRNRTGQWKVRSSFLKANPTPPPDQV
jgi:hypothetical protein